MSETLQWHLKLREDVAGPAKRAAAGLRQYEAAARRTAAADARREAQAQRAAAATARSVARGQASQARSIQSTARLNASAFRRDAALATARARTMERSAARDVRINTRAWRAGQTAVRQSFRESLGTLAQVGAGYAGVALGIVTTFAGIGIAAGAAAVRILAFRETSIAALTAVSGSSKAAERQFRNAMTIANQTPLDTTDVISAQTNFRTAGFSEGETAPLLAAFADISSARGAQAGDAFQRVLAQIRGVGRVNRGDIQMQAVTAGLNASDIYDSIARQMNLGEGVVGRRAAEAAVGSRRVNSGVGTQAFLDATRQAYDNHGQGQLGSFAQGANNTLTGAISNLSNAPINLLMSLNSMKSPGIIALKNAILAVTNALDVSRPSGQAFLRTFEGITNTVGGLIGRILTPANVSAGFGMVGRVFQGIGRFATAAWPVVRAFVTGLGPGFMAAIGPLRAVLGTLLAGGGPSATTMAIIARAASGLGQAIGFVAGVAVTASVAIGGFFTTIVAGMTTFAGLAASVIVPLRTGFVNVGSAIIDGIVQGIGGGLARVSGAVVNMGRTAVTAARDALGIHSPSQVFADQIGRQIPAGVEMGITHNVGPMNAAVANLASPAPMQLGGMGGIQIYVTVTEARSAQETAREVVSDLEDQLGAIFGRMAENYA